MGLAFLMFTVGIKLTLADLAGVFAKPKGLLTGLVSQMLVLPLLAMAISRLFELPPTLATGLLIVAIAPGGITSNYVTLLAGGDVALSTGMTLVTSLAAGVTIPLLLSASGNLLLTANAASVLTLLKIAVGMFAVTAVPLLLGIVLQLRLAAVAQRASRLLDLLSKLVFAAIVAATFYQNWDAMMLHLRVIGPAVATLNLMALLAAFGLGRLARLPRPKRLAIAIETGLQNVAMAIVVAGTLLGNKDLAVPALVYAVMMNISAVILLAAAKRGAPAALPSSAAEF